MRQLVRIVLLVLVCFPWHNHMGSLAPSIMVKRGHMNRGGYKGLTALGANGRERDLKNRGVCGCTLKQGSMGQNPPSNLQLPHV